MRHSVYVACSRYTSLNQRCNRPVQEGNDWCGVCAGYRSPGARVGDHVRTGLADVSSQMIAANATMDDDPRVQEWRASGDLIDRAARMDDAMLTAVADKPLPLPDLAAVASELELRQPDTPALTQIAEQLHARHASLTAVHDQMVAQGRDDEFVQSLHATYVNLDDRRADLYGEMTAAMLRGDQNTEAAEIQGRVAAHGEFAIRVEQETPIHNPEAFDTWVDLEMSNGGYHETTGRARVKGFRDELATIAASLSTHDPDTDE